MCVSDSVGPAFSNFKRYPAASCTRYAKLLDEYQKRPTRLISTISGTYAWDHDYYFRRLITKVKIRPIDRRSISIPLLFLARLPFMRFNILVGMHAYCPLLFGRGTFQVAMKLNIYGIEGILVTRRATGFKGSLSSYSDVTVRQSLDSRSRACDWDVEYHPLSVFNVHAVTARVELSLLECYKGFMMTSNGEILIPYNYSDGVGKISC